MFSFYQEQLSLYHATNLNHPNVSKRLMAVRFIWNNIEKYLADFKAKGKYFSDKEAVKFNKQQKSINFFIEQPYFLFLIKLLEDKNSEIREKTASVLAFFAEHRPQCRAEIINKIEMVLLNLSYMEPTSTVGKLAAHILDFCADSETLRFRDSLLEKNNKIIHNQANYQDYEFIHQHEFLWKETLLRTHSIDMNNDNISAISNFDKKVADILKAYHQNKVLFLNGELLTKSWLKQWIASLKNILIFFLPEEAHYYQPYFIQLDLFTSYISNQSVESDGDEILNETQIKCLNSILLDTPSHIRHLNSYHHWEKLKEPLKKTEAWQTQIKPYNDLPFNKMMEYFAKEEFIPYISIMHAKDNDILNPFFGDDISVLTDFIIHRHISSESLFTSEKIMKYFSPIVDLSGVLPDNFNLKVRTLSAGKISADMTIESDKKNWPILAKTMISRIMQNRYKILECFLEDDGFDRADFCHILFLERSDVLPVKIEFDTIILREEISEGNLVLTAYWSEHTIVKQKSLAIEKVIEIHNQLRIDPKAFDNESFLIGTVNAIVYITNSYGIPHGCWRLCNTSELISALLAAENDVACEFFLNQRHRNSFSAREDLLKSFSISYYMLFRNITSSVKNAILERIQANLPDMDATDQINTIKLVADITEEVFIKFAKHSVAFTFPNYSFENLISYIDLTYEQGFKLLHPDDMNVEKSEVIPFALNSVNALGKLASYKIDALVYSNQAILGIRQILFILNNLNEPKFYRLPLSIRLDFLTKKLPKLINAFFVLREQQLFEAYSNGKNISKLIENQLATKPFIMELFKKIKEFDILYFHYCQYLHGLSSIEACQMQFLIENNQKQFSNISIFEKYINRIESNLSEKKYNEFSLKKEMIISFIWQYSQALSQARTVDEQCDYLEKMKWSDLCDEDFKKDIEKLIEKIRVENAIIETLERNAINVEIALNEGEYFDNLIPEDSVQASFSFFNKFILHLESYYACVEHEHVKRFMIKRSLINLILPWIQQASLELTELKLSSRRKELLNTDEFGYDFCSVNELGENDALYGKVYFIIDNNKIKYRTRLVSDNDWIELEETIFKKASHLYSEIKSAIRSVTKYSPLLKIHPSRKINILDLMMKRGHVCFNLIEPYASNIINRFYSKKDNINTNLKDILFDFYQILYIISTDTKDTLVGKKNASEARSLILYLLQNEHSLSFFPTQDECNRKLLYRGIDKYNIHFYHPNKIKKDDVLYVYCNKSSTLLNIESKFDCFSEDNFLLKGKKILKNDIKWFYDSLRIHGGEDTDDSREEIFRQAKSKGLIYDSEIEGFHGLSLKEEISRLERLPIKSMVFSSDSYCYDKLPYFEKINEDRALIVYKIFMLLKNNDTDLSIEDQYFITTVFDKLYLNFDKKYNLLLNPLFFITSLIQSDILIQKIINIEMVSNDLQENILFLCKKLFKKINFTAVTHIDNAILTAQQIIMKENMLSFLTNTTSSPILEYVWLNVSQIEPDDNYHECAKFILQHYDYFQKEDDSVTVLNRVFSWLRDYRAKPSGIVSIFCHFSTEEIQEAPQEWADIAHHIKGIKTILSFFEYYVELEKNGEKFQDHEISTFINLINPVYEHLYDLKQKLSIIPAQNTIEIKEIEAKIAHIARVLSTMIKVVSPSVCRQTWYFYRKIETAKMHSRNSDHSAPTRLLKEADNFLKRLPYDHVKKEFLLLGVSKKTKSDFCKHVAELKAEIKKDSVIGYSFRY